MNEFRWINSTVLMYQAQHIYICMYTSTLGTDDTNRKSTNNLASEDETFYLPAEQAANRNNMDDIILHEENLENKPPAIKVLPNKDM